MKRQPEDDVLLGRSLAETAHLNAPEQVAGRQAAETVRKAAVQPARARRRHSFWFAALLILIVVAGLAGVLWLTGPAESSS